MPVRGTGRRVRATRWWEILKYAMALAIGILIGASLLNCGNVASVVHVSAPSYSNDVVRSAPLVRDRPADNFLPKNPRLSTQTTAPVASELPSASPAVMPSSPSSPSFPPQTPPPSSQSPRSSGGNQQGAVSVQEAGATPSSVGGPRADSRPVPAVADARDPATHVADSLLAHSIPWLPAGYNPATSATTCAQLRNAFAAGKPESLGLGHAVFLDWYYQCIYKPMVIDKSRPLEVVVWRREGTFGFGNQLRAQHGCFLLALMSERVFAVDDRMFDFYFDQPPGLTFRWSKLKPLLPKKPSQTVIKQVGKEPSVAFDKIDLQSWGRGHDVVVGLLMTNIEQWLVKNSQVPRWFKNLFGTTSGHVRLGMCFNWMLQRPSAAFGEAVRKARARMGLSGPFLALQFRTFKNGKYFHQFKRSHEDGSLWSQLDCIIGDWKKQHPGAKVPRTIFFTTDKPKLFTPKVVQAKLKKYGKVVVNSGGYEPSGKLGARAWRSVSQALVDWYLLGEALPAIVGGTSYGNSAAARTGYQHGLFYISPTRPCDAKRTYAPPLTGIDPIINQQI